MCRIHLIQGILANFKEFSDRVSSLKYVFFSVISSINIIVLDFYSGLTSLAVYFFTKEVWSAGAGLFAACFIAIGMNKLDYFIITLTNISEDFDFNLDNELIYICPLTPKFLLAIANIHYFPQIFQNLYYICSLLVCFTSLCTINLSC